MGNLINLGLLDFGGFPAGSAIYCDCDSLPIKNYINDEIFIPISGSGGSLEVGRFGNSLRMGMQDKFSYVGDLSTSSQMTFSFWLNSTNYAPVYDQSDPEVFYYVKMPVFSKSSWSVSSATQSYVLDWTNSSFLVYEKCYEDNTNSIIVDLYENGSYDLYRYESERYEIGKNHHFYVAYDGVNGFVNIYIDGIMSELSVTAPGAVAAPYQISSSGNPLIINDIAPGVVSSVVGSSSLLDDLFICNTSFDSEGLIQRIINRGMRDTFSSDVSLRKNKQTLFLPYKEISTNYITSISGNSSEVYLGSSYGDIYKGSSTSWSSRRNFTNQNEIDNLNLIKYDSSNNSSYSTEDGDGIKIDGYGIELE
jgi:hypothetical protein